MNYIIHSNKTLIINILLSIQRFVNNNPPGFITLNGKNVCQSEDSIQYGSLISMIRRVSYALSFMV